MPRAKLYSLPPLSRDRAPLSRMGSLSPSRASIVLLIHPRTSAMSTRAHVRGSTVLMAVGHDRHQAVLVRSNCYLSLRSGPRSFRYATMSSTSWSVNTMKPPRLAEPTGSCASVKLKNR
jgi:hypothetical protein